MLTPLYHSDSMRNGSSPVIAPTSSSSGFSVIGSVSALKMALQILDTPHSWETEGQNPQTRMWKTLFEGLRQMNALPFSAKELVTIAAETADAINRFMAKSGYPEISLAKFAPDAFGVASVMDVTVEFPERGEEVSLNIPGWGKVDAAKVVRNLSYFASTLHPHEVFRLDTTSNDLVYLTKATDGTLAGLALLAHLIEISQSLKVSYNAYRGVIFPMASFRQKTDVKFLTELHVIGNDGGVRDIQQAQQVDVFELDHIGALASSAFAAEVRLRGASPQPYIMDAPYWAWIERKGLPIPIGTYFISGDAWKRPNRNKK